MIDDISIQAAALTKTYKLYNSPQCRLKESLHPLRKKYHQDFYALNNVTFQIKKGETVGIVGRNGSGKSTLLKMITGVLTPSSGAVSVNGKISALLELGAGFNPELSGIDNVYFNGTLMGYAREEMDHRLDNILSFADIGPFVHQPVKSYSSGMFVRLAFAVAINVDPDILIIDEALSVGDEAFQRKCFSRILDYRKNGKTILFVSHAASTIIELCDKAILLDEGELLLEGAPKPVVTRYQRLIFSPPEKLPALREEFRELARSIKEGNEGSGGCDAAEEADPAEEAAPAEPPEEKAVALYDPNLVVQSTMAYESRGALIIEPHITTVSGEKVNVLVRGEEYVYTYDVAFEKDVCNVRFAMMIKDVTGIPLGGMVSRSQANAINFIPKGTTKKQAFSFRCAFLPGAYFMNAGVLGAEDGTEVYLHRLIDAYMFRVQPEENLNGTGTVDISVN